MEQEVSRLISIVVLATGGGIVVGGANRLGDIHIPFAHKSLVFVAVLVKIFRYRYQN